MYVFDFKVLLICTTKEIYSKQFLIGKDRGTVITELLAVELECRLINIADIYL